MSSILVTLFILSSLKKWKPVEAYFLSALTLSSFIIGGIFISNSIYFTNFLVNFLIQTIKAINKKIKLNKAKQKEEITEEKINIEESKYEESNKTKAFLFNLIFLGMFKEE